MLPPVFIDISDIVQQSYLNESEVRSLSKSILNGVYESYKRLWQQQYSVLKSTRAIYEGAVSSEFIDDFNMAFILNGDGVNWIALALEEGKAPYDLKEGFSKSDKRKPSYRNKESTGWYLTIPFRVATPEALAESSLFSYSANEDEFMTKMPKKVYDVAKTGATITNSNIPIEFVIKDKRAEINRMDIKVPEYEHKSNRWEGVKRSESGQYQGRYFKFRRVCDRSDPNSWWHKGFETHEFMKKALSELNSSIDIITGDVIENWFKSNK